MFIFTCCAVDIIGVKHMTVTRSFKRYTVKPLSTGHIDMQCCCVGEFVLVGKPIVVGTFRLRCKYMVCSPAYMYVEGSIRGIILHVYNDIVTLGVCDVFLSFKNMRMP